MVCWNARPLTVSVGVVTAAVLAVTLVPDPAAVGKPLDAALPAGVQAMRLGPDAASGGELVADDEIGARVQARATGRRVEVLSERSTTSRTWANPDGTWSTEEAAGPVRFVDGTGVWQDIDLDLEVDPASGAVAPAAHPLGLELPSGSGAAAPALSEVSVAVGGEAAEGSVDSEELAPVTETSGEQVSIGWPGRLPEPVLDGPVATYAGVTPGVDLQVQATSVGFETFMVVQERPAAGEVLSWALPVTLTGAEAVSREDGSVAFVSTGEVAGGTPAGEVVSELPAAHAWDAQVDEAADVPTNLSDVAMTVSTTADGGAVVTVTPDQGWLQDPATVFPVTVDPSYASIMLTATADTYVQSDTGATVHGGKTELRIGTYNGGAAVAQSFVSFDSANLAGKTVQSARLELYATHSYSCQLRGWEVWSAGTFSETTTTWANKPSMLGRYALVNPTYGFGPGCAAQWVQVDIRTLAQAWANQAVGTKNLGVKAEDETDTYAWKKFASREDAAHSPKIFFTYNQAPAAPGAPRATGFVPYAPPGGIADNYTPLRTPSLTAAATDPDANTVKYEIQAHSGMTVTSSSLLATCTTGLVASATTGACTSPQLPDNTKVFLRARAIDEVGAVSGWSGWWGLNLAAGPPTPPTVVCPGYADGSWTTVVPSAGVVCTITASNSGATTAGYILHSLDGSATSTRQLITPPAAGATTSIQVTLPNTPGRHSIRTLTESRPGVTSTAVDFSAGWGASVTMISPKPLDTASSTSDGVTVTTDVVAVSAAGPDGGTAGGGAPTAKVQWRTAGAPAGAPWNDATGATATVSSTGTGSSLTYVATGKVSTKAMTTDNGTPLNDRVPVRLEVRLCLVYGATTTNCAVSPGVVQRVPHAFGSSFPVAAAGPGQVALWTGEWSTSATDVSVPGYTGDLSVSRTHATYTGGGSTADAVTGVFGPGWTANFDGSESGVAGDRLIDSTRADGTLVLFAEDDTPWVWAPTADATQVARRSGATLAGGRWAPADEDTKAAGAVLTVTGTGAPAAGTSTATKAVVTVTMEDGTVTTFDSTAAVSATTDLTFSPVSVTEPGTPSATSFTRDAVGSAAAGRVTRILAPVPPGVSGCTSDPTGWTSAQRGCRAMTISYATATTSSASVTGDIAGQVKEISTTLWDPGAATGAGAMATVVVARYAYGASKRLATVTDPRTGLGTGYGYDGSSPRLSRITPPGLTPIDLTYVASSESGTGGSEVRFARATRARPGTDPAGGTATLANIVYNIPVAGTSATSVGLPDMPPLTGAWQQAKAPTYAAGVFGPEAPAAAQATTSAANLTAGQLRYGDLQYTDAEGYTVNTASYGAGAWQVTATDYDDKGNTVRTLDARATAAITAGQGIAAQLADYTFYDADGILVTDTLGPVRSAVLPDGTTAQVREWTHTDYDTGAPTTGSTAGINPTTGNPWRLPTIVTSVTVPATVSSAVDIAALGQARSLGGDQVLSRSFTSYGTTEASWTLGLPTSVTQDVDASGTVNGGDITTETTYDAEGRVTSTTQPGATPGEASTDAGTTLTRYYSVGAHPLDAACGNTPHWAGLVCTTGPGSSSPLPTTRSSAYSTWLLPTTVLETTGTATGAPVLRTSTTRYDTAGRVTGTSATSSVAGNVATTGSETRYRAADGLVSEVIETPTGTTVSTSASDRRTSSTYDTWGRALTVTGDDGLTTTTTYDPAGRVDSLTVPVGGGSAGITTNHVTTYTYDGTDSRGGEERRGLLTRISVTGLADQAGAYDQNGTLVHELLPGRITRTRTYDSAGEPTEVVYTGPTMTRDTNGALVPGEPAPWFAWAQANDVEGRVRAEWTPNAIGYNAPTGDGTDLPVAGQATGYSRVYTYDRVERLTRVQDYTRAAPGTGGTSDPTAPTTSSTGLLCTARAYTFDTRGRRTQLTSTPGDTTGTGACPAPGTPAVTTRTATYDTADRPLTGTTNLTGTPTTGDYVYDTLGRQTVIPAVDSPAYTAGDSTAGPIQVTYDTTDTARTINQVVSVRTGTSAAGDPVIERLQEATTLALDSTGRRQTETITSQSLDTAGTPTGTANTISTLTRHYNDSSDNPSWTYRNSPGAAQERAYGADGVGGYTATIASNLAGDLVGGSLNIANLHGDVITTVPLSPASPGTSSGAGPTATSIATWTRSDEYGNSSTANAARAFGQALGSSTISGPAYGWLGTHERALGASGLIFMGARLYNSVVGAFTGPDPIPGGNSTAYTYPQDPVNQLDLDGKKKKKKKWYQKKSFWGNVVKGVGYAAMAACIVASAGICAAAAGAAFAASAIYRTHGYVKNKGYRSRSATGRYALGLAADAVAWKVPGVRYRARWRLPRHVTGAQHQRRYVYHSLRSSLRTSRGRQYFAGQLAVGAYITSGF